jgi:hypothetical protein
MIERGKPSTEIHVASSSWAGAAPGAGASEWENARPARRWQFIILAALLPAVAIWAWIEMFRLLYEGSLAARHGRVTFEGDPVSFLIMFMIWFGWGSMSGYIAFRALTSAQARRILIATICKGWRRAT